MDWKHFLLQGGPVVWFLMFLFVVVLVVIVERFLFFKNYFLLLDYFEKQFSSSKTLTGLKETDDILFLGKFSFSRSWLYLLEELETALQDRSLMLDDFVEEKKKQFRLREMKKLEQYLVFLATIGNLSPFIGLLGTVFGIIRSFVFLGEGNISEINKGIAEALVATAFGLLVAIPASSGYNYFRKSAEDALLKIELIFSMLKSLIAKQWKTLQEKN